MRRSIFALVPLLLGACTPDAPEADSAEPLPAYAGDLEFVDDAQGVTAFAVLRDTLRAVIARRDTAALLDRVGADARLSFGDAPGGPEGFRSMWFDAPPDEPVWDLLARILDGGCVEEDGAIVVPAVAALWPDDLDPFGHVAVLGDDVDALAQPGGDPVASLTRIVLPTTGPAEDGWQPVRLPDGSAAVVPVDAVLSPVGYRATFWEDADGWRLRTFLAGD